ncbi:K02A2.6-like [Cordylochernes scorpioides]|uniref:RNA-directed DNA polymerase n=1 Tax=Cordylochernes scorpioides TaxID=51811 RepID=A0ABY6KCQ7_9ARAC|nr:K02A2.6-like [Cordylochernes scorpioides]
MANYIQVAAPEGFNFGKPNEWPIWFKRFQRYRIASGLSEKSENEQVNALIYIMGDKAEEIVILFNLSEAQIDDYKLVVSKFQDYFIGKRNVIYERAKFNRRSQGEMEPVEEFITNLYVLAETCSYGSLKEEMIRDRLVVGVKNFNLSEKLQLESELTLEKAIQIVRQSESVKNQQKEIRQDTENRNVDVIDRKGGRNGTIFQKTRMKGTKTYNSNFPKNPQGWSSNEKRKCFRCGYYQGHSKEQCPAKDAICNKCRKKGHFAKVCQTKTVQEVSSSQNYAFIGIVGMQENAEGAEVSVMPEGIYLQHFGYLKTEKADKNLFAVSKKIEVNGMFQAFLESKRQKCEETIYIVKGVARPLLSCRASEILGLVRRINIVKDHAPTKLDPMLKFPKLFNGLGKINIPYEIKLKEGAKPYSIYTPRRVPIPLMKELQMELERMTSNGVIEKVEGSSEWCSPMVLVAKPSGKLRICVDLSILNQNILREIHPIPVVEHTLAQLKGAKVFTKLDANSGFWQIPLSSESSALTTFITPFGRFRFKRLPFGISSAPEIFQKRMGQILEGLEGTLCHMDDIMVYVTTIKFLGHQIGPNGIQVDPKRKRAILEFPKPRSVKELKQFLGMVNFSARFVPNLAEIAHPMNKLLSKKEEWIWGDDQDRAFDQIKKNLTSAQGLALYDPSLPITVSADASSFGLGAVIWQTKDGLRQVIAYASRTLSETEKRYAQIEKEALAITWACEKFKQYIQGLVITLETDHKPLVPIFTSKNIDDLTPRIQRLRLRIMRYSYKIVHTPGKNLIVADALSKVVSFMPISDVRVKEIKESQDKDQVIQNIIKYTQEGWPERTNVSMSESQYWPAKDDFSVENGILLKGSRYVIPENIRKGLLQRIHEGHLGIVKCRERAKGSVWWPRITSEIEEMVRTCPMCIEERTNRHQPLLPSELPNCPWEKVGVDLFTLKGQNYLLITDYYSINPEIARLEDMTSASVIVHCKSIFARHGIPLEVRSDNGPQFGSLFKEFAHDYGFTHVTSSPRYPQSNGFIESFVKIVKERISKSKDPYLALLAYRATPLANGFSPAELSMGRRVRTTIPTPTKQHQPPNLKNLKNQEASQREKQKYYFDRAKGVRELPPLDVNDRVWLTDLKTPGVIISKADTPRSYMVDTPRGSVRRNGFHLLPTGQRSPGPPHFEPDEEPYINYPEANTHTSDAPMDKKAKWKSATPNVKIGDLVLIMEQSISSPSSILGRVSKTFHGPDMLVRTVELCTGKGLLLRPVNKEAVMLMQSDLTLTTVPTGSMESSVAVQWLPAHVGIPGNQLAHSLAKAGAFGLPVARESTTQLDERDLLRTIKTQCLQEWKSNAAYDWYRAGGTSTGSVLPREKQSWISRLKSGHLRTITLQNGCKVFPLCTKCNSQPATPKHIIDCIDSSIDELYSSPADTIKSLKLYKLDNLI